MPPKKTIKILLINSIFITIFTTLFSTPAKSAEKIKFTYGPLSFTITIDSLEIFAKTGELKPDLAPYATQIDSKTLTEIRLLLNKSFNFPQTSLSKISRTSLAEDLLKQLGKVISSHNKRNGFYAIRGAILTAAINKDSWNLIEVFRAFPNQEIYVNLELLAQLKDELFAYQSYGEAVAKAIDNVAEKNTNKSSFSQLEKLPDLAKTGKYQVTKKTITLKKNQLRQTKEGFVSQYQFPVDFYLPEDSQQKFPLVLISHGFGSVRENFTTLAQHLASHGFIVAVPQHIGSDLQYRQELLKGTLSSALSPIEYVARPTDLSYIIDYLEDFRGEDSSWQKRANLSQIGVIGDSLGGTTALAIAGAEFNANLLEAQCNSEQVIINTALILQCQASYLPPAKYKLADSRVKAVIATHPLVSGIFGGEGLSKIKIPTLITAGNKDIITPFVIEQIHPFLSLKNIPKHLIFFQPGTHFSSTKPSPEFALDNLPEFLVGKNRDLTSQYFQGIAVAFLEVYLKNNADYLVYLSSDYGKFRETESLQVKQINQLTINDLSEAYGGDIPFPLETPVTFTPSWENESAVILEDIKKTGVLKIGYPQNSPPFGYINDEGKWEGFCLFLGENFARYLETNFQLDFQPKLVFLPIDVANRFNLVTGNQVHFECGYSIPKNKVNQLVISEPFLVTGNQILIAIDKAKNFNLNQLNSLNIGVISPFIEEFIHHKYPQAKIINLSDSQEIFSSLDNSTIDVFMGNSIFLQKTLTNDLSKYNVIPKLPISCDYYSLYLPDFDPQWLEIVNGFLRKEGLTKIYFNHDINKSLMEQLNYCLNFNK